MKVFGYILVLGFTGFSFAVISVKHISRQHPRGASVADNNDLSGIDAPIIYRPNAHESGPICLPSLSEIELSNLMCDKRVQCQKRVGREGYGWVVLDVKAPPDRVFETLQSFKRYEEMIPTVRSAKILALNEKTVVAEFSLSRFRLPVNVIQNVDLENKVIRFVLDQNRPNPVISKVEGYWFVQLPDGREGYSRVWLYANVVASRLVPSFIVDYAASRALPRATEWLLTYFDS